MNSVRLRRVIDLMVNDTYREMGEGGIVDQGRVHDGGLGGRKSGGDGRTIREAA